MKKRPVNLKLTTLQFPIPSIISILHRMSGVILFLFIPVILMLWGSSLNSREQFDRIVQGSSFLPVKLVIWIFLIALIYHLLAGCRHLMMDLGWGESLKSSRRSSYLVLLLTILVTIGLGCRLW